MSKSVVLVTGCSGNLGSAAVKHMSAKHADKLEIKAGTRNPEKCDKLKDLTGVSVVQAEIGNKESLSAALSGVDYLYLIPPQTENRETLTSTTLEAAKEAGVKHIVFQSVFYADQDDMVFGKQYRPVEAKLKSLGIPYTIVRIVMFIDNHFGLKDLIAAQSQVIFPVDPDKPYTPVAIQDICRAVGAILKDPSLHSEKTYHLASDRFKLGDLAKEFSSALEKEVTYLQVPYDVALKAFLDLGFQQWQGDGLMDLYRGIDAGAEYVNRTDISDFKTITGEEPTTLKAWVAQVAPIFKL